LGKINDYKRADLLIEALPMVKNNNIEAHFYGNGPHEKNLKNLIIKLNLQQKAFIHDPTRDVKKLISQHQIFVFPSPYESAYSQSLLEAIAASRITILKYTDGIKKFFPENSIIGLNKINPEKLAVSIDFAIENYEDCLAAAERGSEIVKSMFSFDYFNEQTKDII